MGPANYGELSESFAVLPTRSEQLGEDLGLSVAIIPLPGFTITPFACFLDALRAAGDEKDLSRQIRCRWTIMSSEDRPVASSSGVTVQPWQILSGPAAYDYIVVCGGIMHNGPHNDPVLTEFLQEAAEAGVGLIGLCTGSFVLARSGLMNGYTCCVHYFHHLEFKREFPKHRIVSNRIYVVDRDRITCVGGTSAGDLAVYLIRRHLGLERVRKAMRFLVLDRERPADHAPAWFPFNINDSRVRQAVALMLDQQIQPLSIKTIAARVNTSQRQLHRVFLQDIGMSPAGFYRTLRLESACWLLSNTDHSVTEVAYKCGFADSSHLCRVFKQEQGHSPAAFRRNSRRSAISGNQVADHVQPLAPIPVGVRRPEPKQRRLVS